MAERSSRPDTTLRHRDWFSFGDQGQAKHTTIMAPAARRAENAVIAGLYLASVIALPILVALAIWHPLNAPAALYGLPIAACGTLPYFLTQDLCRRANKSIYSPLALRTQLWVQLGGAVPSAIHHLKQWRANR